MRIAVAMSGGVDSSVAALLLRDEGHEVIGLSMQLWDHSGESGRSGRCCTLDDLSDARRVAWALGIRHYVLNLEKEFRRACAGTSPSRGPLEPAIPRSGPAGPRHRPHRYARSCDDVAW